VTDETAHIKSRCGGHIYFEVSYIGYEKIIFTGIVLKQGESKTLNMQMNPTAVTIDQEVVIIGEKPLMDVEESKSSSQITR
jgi:hypothetical protein